MIWWDGDLLRELVAGSNVTKWNWQTHAEERLFATGRPFRRPGPERHWAISWATGGRRC